MFKYTFDLFRTANPDAWAKLQAEWREKFGNTRSLGGASRIKATEKAQISTVHYQFYIDFLAREAADFGAYTPEGYAFDLKTVSENKRAYETVLEVLREAGVPLKMSEILALIPIGAGGKFVYSTVNSSCRHMAGLGLVRKVGQCYEAVEVNPAKGYARRVSLIADEVESLMKAGCQFDEIGKRPYALRVTFGGNAIGMIEYKAQYELFRGLRIRRK